jgi:putative GTP pyrophosphokinase
MAKDVTGAILQSYDINCALYLAFTKKIEDLLTEIIVENGLKVHSITSRLKARTSLERKLKANKYSRLEDVTDICGIRIISFYADDVDKIADVVQKEFLIDKKNSVDKRALLDPDRFGYLSLHFVAKLPESRLKLTEYKRFGNCQVEIQIRSILQHAWAEIEHDLGYKGRSAVPRQTRRRFSRLAGLLELGDSEFVSIRDSLRDYEENVPQEIKNNPELVLIDKASISSFIQNNELCRAIDAEIGQINNLKLHSDKILNEDYVDELKTVGIKNVLELDTQLVANKDKIVALANKVFKKHPSEAQTYPEGICIFYLCYVLIASQGSQDKVSNYLKVNNIGPDTDDERNELAKFLIDSC